MNYYRDAGFVPYNYWTSDAAGSFQFDVYSYSGLVGNAFVSSSRYVLCTAP
jgi:hypothetical protein